MDMMNDDDDDDYSGTCTQCSSAQTSSAFSEIFLSRLKSAFFTKKKKKCHDDHLM